MNQENLLDNQEALINFMKGMNVFSQLLGMVGKGDQFEKTLSALTGKKPEGTPNSKTPEKSNVNPGKKRFRSSERKLSNLTDDEEVSYREKMKSIITQVDIHEVVIKLLLKLYLKDPIYEMSESNNKMGKWKCTVRINYGGNDIFQGVGYNSQKKKAKSKFILKLHI